MFMFDLIDFIMPIFFILFFIIFFGILFMGISSSIKTKRQNDNSPRLTVNASIVAKRTHVYGHEHSHTSYYVTFQVESGDRMELNVPSEEYGMLAEDDNGQLTFQGTRYISFKRTY